MDKNDEIEFVLVIVWAAYLLSILNLEAIVFYGRLGEYVPI